MGHMNDQSHLEVSLELQSCSIVLVHLAKRITTSSSGSNGSGRNSVVVATNAAIIVLGMLAIAETVTASIVC